ncbi:DUF2373 family protein [Rhizoctonia solani AG-3 Rhs1AP]|uniref:DUF2373 family protein n=1 Tax=Rhizoctonia solani AG-3 Rhs1AP TaxID=1086054 RepID=X8JUW6_9AGAM|nr:DUF2373 family protein [Rhizoctonia solani AG-3 Rhs1AP]
MAGALAVPPPDPIEKKLKKQEQKSQSADTRPDPTHKEKKKRRKQHEDPSASEVGASEAAQVMESSDRPTKKLKKDGLEAVVAEDQLPPGLEGTSLKPPKREKRPKKPKDKSKRHKEEAPNPIDKIQIVDVSIPYTNPLTDETLPDFAQRGLAYAYQYAQHISLASESERAEKHAWKFNKARQNWILRNITDPTIIPDSHLSISLVYVTSIQGGARDELKKTCKTTKKQAKASKALSSNDQNESNTEVNQPSEVTGESPKKVTFASGTAEPAIVEPKVSAPSKAKVKRAKIILKVLKGKVKPQDI